MEGLARSTVIANKGLPEILLLPISLLMRRVWALIRSPRITYDQLSAALADAKKQTRTSVVAVETDYNDRVPI